MEALLHFAGKKTVDSAPDLPVGANSGSWRRLLALVGYSPSIRPPIHKKSGGRPFARANEQSTPLPPCHILGSSPQVQLLCNATTSECLPRLSEFDVDRAVSTLSS